LTISNISASAQNETVDAKKVIRKTIDTILSTENEAEKHYLIGILKPYAEQDVVDAWMEKLDSSKKMSVINEILNHMSLYNDRRLVVQVAEHLIHQHQSVRQNAAKALKKIGDDRLFPIILKMADSQNPVHRIYFLEAMSYLYDRRFFNSIVNMMRDESKSVRIYTIACILKNRLSEALPQIRSSAMSDQNNEVRLSSISAIGEFKDSGSMHVLQRTINDDSKDIRLESVKAIASIGITNAIFPLSSRLFIEEDNEIKSLIMEVMASNKKTGDIKGLEKIITSDHDARMRIKAAYLIGISFDTRAQSILLSKLADPDFRVRAEVCSSLSNYRNRQVATALADLMAKELDRYVRTSALYSIKRIGDKTSLIRIFDVYSKEKDSLFRDILRHSIREALQKL
jgi:HEAT repeat protein